eukprot:jgi/Botrbrau1/17418/Bobra.0054s0014.1
MNARLLPFSDPQHEEEFKLLYHRRKIPLDRFVGAMIAALYCNALLSLDKSRVFQRLLWTHFVVVEIMVMCFTLHPSYPSWRQRFMLLTRGVGATAIFFSVREAIVLQKAPTFLVAAAYSLFSFARGKLLFLFATMYQLKDNYHLWRSGGGRPACMDFCHNLLEVTSGSCAIVCRALLPAAWRLYGPPWARLCILQRYVIGVVLGYITPLVGLFLMEIMERREFATSKGLDVSDLGSSLKHEFRFVLVLASKCLLMVAVCLWGF